MSYDPLIYGKNPLERVVSIEPQDGHIEVFCEDSNGIVTSQFIESQPWILSHYNHGKGWIRLAGDQYYQYGKKYHRLEEFERARFFLKHKEIFYMYDLIESSLIKTGITYFKGMQPSDVSILSFDIETSGLKHNDDSRVFLISNTFRKQGKIIRKLFAYDEYENEGEMIREWCKWVREMNPSILCGHNCLFFDLPMLSFVGGKYGVSLELGRDGSAIRYNDYESKFRKDATQFYHYHKARVYGREIVDTMFLAVKSDISRKYESYGLKQIIKQENLEVKDRQFYDASQIRFKYKDPIEWEKIKKYCVHDSDDALALFDLMISPIFYFTMSIPKSFQEMICSASGSQLNSLMIRSYLQYGHSIPKADEVEHFEGAISFGLPGVYRNVLKADFASLYPSLIRQYEIYNPQKDPKANFLKMVEYFTIERLKNKKLAHETGNRYYSDLEQSQKIGINSSYGMLGAPGLNFNSIKHAALVTSKGRELLKQSILWATGKDYEYWKSKCGGESEEIDEDA